MAEDFSVLSEQASSVINDHYYKQLQSQLKEKRDIEQHDQKNEHQGDEFEDSVSNSTSKTKRVDRRDRIQKIQDKVHIQSLSWEMDDKGEYQLSSDQRPQVLTSVDLENNGQKILRSLGHKIDYNSKMGQMKQQFMQNIIQSRSSNFFLSIYASFKVGLMGQLMSLMGMDPKEIEKMKREAIEEARKENIQLMEENVYTIELTESIKGKGKSNRRSIEMLYENQSQLVVQMDKLGNIGFWSKIRLLEEQIKQDNVIIEEFQNEKKRP
jgi:predicted RND superfamily exporter protein